MVKSINKTKRGFTIIEVVLVLAIAGLIFLMVFVGFPALQRSQRDTQRRNDMARLITQLSSYQTNNGGTVPTGGGGDTPGYEDSQSPTWGKFMVDYMKRKKTDSGGTAQDSEFKDPLSNENYTFYVYTSCKSKSDGEKCAYPNATQIKNHNPKFIVINHYATCDGESPVHKDGARSIAVAIALEGGGYYCTNN